MEEGILYINLYVRGNNIYKEIIIKYINLAYTHILDMTHVGTDHAP